MPVYVNGQACLASEVKPRGTRDERWSPPDAKDGEFEVHHYAFHVDDNEFDAILARLRAAGIPYGSAPWHIEDRQPIGGMAGAASISATPTGTCSNC